MGGDATTVHLSSLSLSLPPRRRGGEALTQPGHNKIPRIENLTENTKNQTESTKIEFFGTLFGSGEPNFTKCAEFGCSYIIIALF